MTDKTSQNEIDRSEAYVRDVIENIFKQTLPTDAEIARIAAKVRRVIPREFHR